MKKVMRLTESDLTRLVKRVLEEQVSPQTRPTTPVQQVSPQTRPTNSPVPVKNQSSGPYCKIGSSQGIIKQHTVGTSGPNVNLGETGFGLFDSSGKLICKISTKYTQGGYVTTPSR